MIVTFNTPNTLNVRSNERRTVLNINKAGHKGDTGDNGASGRLTQIIATDADIIAETYSVHIIPSGVLSADRDFSLVDIIADMDYLEVVNYEEAFEITITGPTVYELDGITTITTLKTGLTQIRRLNGKVTIIN